MQPLYTDRKIKNKKKQDNSTNLYPTTTYLTPAFEVIYKRKGSKKKDNAVPKLQSSVRFGKPEAPNVVGERMYNSSISNVSSIDKDEMDSLRKLFEKSYQERLANKPPPTNVVGERIRRDSNTSNYSNSSSPKPIEYPKVVKKGLLKTTMLGSLGSLGSDEYAPAGTRRRKLTPPSSLDLNESSSAKPKPDPRKVKKR